MGLLNPIIFGSPGVIVKAAIEDGATFLSAFRLTLGEIALAVAIAWVLGVGFGVLAGASEALARILIAVPLSE